MQTNHAEQKGLFRKLSAAIASTGFIFVAVGISAVFAAVTISGTSITGDASFNAVTGGASTVIDVGTGNTLSLQTTNNGPITAGNGLFTINGPITANGTVTAAGKLLVGGNLNVTGTATFASPAVFGNNVTFSGVANSLLYATSTGQLAPVTIGSGLTLTGNTLSAGSDSAIMFSVDGGGSAITSGNLRCASAPYSGTISGWNIVADQSGSIQFDIWKTPFGASLPTLANSIVATDPPLLSNAITATFVHLTGWTTDVSKGDLVCVKVAAVSTVTVATLTINIKR